NGIGYQLAQGWFAFASGGMVGTGLGLGSPTFIPYVGSDFILAAFGEELGMLGVAGILLLYLVLIGRGLRIGGERQDSFGQLLAADERTVLAESIKNPDPNSVYRFLRKYPGRELYGQLTGYYSRIYGLSGLEDAMNPYLSGTAPEFTAQNLTDILLGRPKV